MIIYSRCACTTRFPGLHDTIQCVLISTWTWTTAIQLTVHHAGILLTLMLTLKTTFFNSECTTWIIKNISIFNHHFMTWFIIHVILGNLKTCLVFITNIVRVIQIVLLMDTHGLRLLLCMHMIHVYATIKQLLVHKWLDFRKSEHKTDSSSAKSGIQFIRDHNNKK